MIYILTNPELGWNCTLGVYDSYEKVLKALAQYENFSYNDVEDIDTYANSSNSVCSIQTARLNEAPN